MARKLSLTECYDALELKPGARLEHVKIAYRKMSKRFHPDQHVVGSASHAKSMEKQIQLNQAYEQLVQEILTNGPAKTAPHSTERSARQRSAGVSDWAVEEEGERAPNFSPAEFAALLTKAKAGDTQAQFQVGLCIELGSSGQEKDPASAAWWYERAMNQNSLDAMVRLALLHLYGRGVKQNRHRTKELLSRAASKNHPEAMYQLGLFLSVILDQEEQGRQWYRRAAASGHSVAGKMLVTLDNLES